MRVEVRGMTKWGATLGALLTASVITGAAPAVAQPPGKSPAPPPPPAKPLRAVVALIDSGINPYAPAFRDRSRIAYKHPSTYIPGYPKDALKLPVTLDVPYEEAMEKDATLWKTVERGKLYWVPGTRIVGAISFGNGGTNCPVVPAPPANILQEPCPEHVILDDHGHGTMTASRAAGWPNSLAPGARIVEIEGLGARGVTWAAEQSWIDVQSNSWLSFIPPPVPGDIPEAFAAAADVMPTIAGSGNGAAYIAGFAPTPTYVLSTAAPDVILVGGHDNGKMTLWSGSPPHVVADAYAGMTAIRDSLEMMRPDPIACCTSAAAPYGAGGAAAIVAEARRLLHATYGRSSGMLACGNPGKIKSGPLADGDFTLDEFKDVYFHTADARPDLGRDDGEVHWAGGPRAPDHPQFGPGANPFCFGCTTTPVSWTTIPEGADVYPLIGYGAINEHSLAAATDVLAGKAELPARAAADAQYEADQALRRVIFEQQLGDERGAGSCPATAKGGR